MLMLRPPSPALALQRNNFFIQMMDALAHK